MIEEEIKSGMDIVLVAVEVMVCMNCGERYYDRNTDEEKLKIRDQD